jgi:hypothetical protein
LVPTGKGDVVGPADPDVAAFDGPGDPRALFRATDWSATPIRDTDGAVVGIFTASTQTTAKFVGARRTRGGAGAGRAVRGRGRKHRRHLPRGVEGAATDPGKRAVRGGLPARCGRPGQRIAAYGLADASPPPANTTDTTDGTDGTDGPHTTVTADGTDTTDSADGTDGPVGAVGIPAGVIDRVLETGVAEIVTGLRSSAPGAFLPGPIGPRARTGCGGGDAAAGRWPAEAGIVLYELSPKSRSMEQAFMDLTRDAVDYPTHLAAPVLTQSDRSAA